MERIGKDRCDMKIVYKVGDVSYKVVDKRGILYYGYDYTMACNVARQNPGAQILTWRCDMLANNRKIMGYVKTMASLVDIPVKKVVYLTEPTRRDTTDERRGNFFAAHLERPLTAADENKLRAAGWVDGYNGGRPTPGARCLYLKIDVRTIWGDTLQLFPDGCCRLVGD